MPCYEDARTRVYRIDLAAGESTGAVDYDFSGLFVSVSSASLTLREGSLVKTTQWKTGDIHLHEGPAEVELRNRSDTHFRAYLAEWR